MVLKKLLHSFNNKPWYHTDPVKRLSALKKLPSGTSQSQQIFTEQLQDETLAQHRQWLIKQLVSLDTLLAISRQPQDQAWVIQRLWQLSLNQAFEQQEQLQALLDPTKLSIAALTEQCLHNQSLWLQQQCITVNSDQVSLSEVVLNVKSRALRELAAEKIVDIDCLQKLHKKLQNKDKNTLRIVKDKLKALKDKQQQQQHLLQQLQQLSSQCTRHSEKPADNLYAATWQHLWDKTTQVQQQLHDDFETAQQQSLNTQLQMALTHYQQQQQRYDEQKQLAVEQQLALDQAKQELANTLTALANTLEQLQNTQEDVVNLLPHITAELKLQRRRWQQACELQTPTAEQKNLYGARFETLYSFEAALQRLVEQQDLIQQLIDQPDVRSIKQLIKRINWPQALTLPEQLSQLYSAADVAVEQQLHDKKQQQAYYQKIDNSLNELEKQLQQGNSKAAAKTKQKLRQWFTDNSPQQQHWQRLKGYEQDLANFNSWQQYAETPKKQQLCEAMEGLIDSQQDVDKLAQKIKKLQEQYKALNATGKNQDQKLWLRFQAAAEKAYAPCKEAFKRRSEQQKLHEKARIAICEQLENYLQSVDWQQADWNKVEQLQQLAKQQWRDSGQVDIHKYRKLNQRFLKSSNLIRDQLKQQRDANIELKRQLITQTQALMDEADLSQALEQCKSHQQQWKQIGITPYKTNRELWQQFRNACDNVFERREKVKNADIAQREQDLQQGKAIIEQIKQHSNKQQLRQSKSEYKQLPIAVQKRLNKAFDNQIQAFEQRLIAEKNQQQKQALDQLMAQAQQCHQLEQLVLQDNFSAAQEFALDVSSDIASAPLKARWQQAKDAAEQQQNQKLSELCQSNSQPYQNQCIALEISAGIASPPDKQQLRLQLQVEQLQQGFGQGGKSSEQQHKDAVELLHRLLTLGPISEELFVDIQPRVQQARSALSL